MSSLSFSNLMACLGAIVGGIIGAFLVWLIFWRRAEPVPSAYLHSGQLRPLSVFEKLMVEYVFPGSFIKKRAERSRAQVTKPELSEDYSVSCWYPKSVKPETTSVISIFITPGEEDTLRPQDPASIQILKENDGGHFVGLSPDASERLDDENNLMIVPRFNRNVSVFPSKHFVDWVGETRVATFFIAAKKRQHNKPLEITFRLLAGLMVRLEFNLTISAAVDTSEPKQMVQKGVPYHKVFVSYAHDDSEIINSYIEAHKKQKDYVIDSKFLKPGEKWGPKILWKIAECDKLQLFWSNRSMRSENVKCEWEFAFKLKRDHFVIPSVWERPFPEDKKCKLPPPELADLHFEPISNEVKRKRSWFAASRALALFMPNTVKAVSVAILVGCVSTASISSVAIGNYFFRGPEQTIERIEYPNREKPVVQKNWNPTASPSPSPQLAQRIRTVNEPIVLKDDTLWGHVLDEQGKPIANAIVSYDSDSSATTDAEGRFELQVPEEQRPRDKFDITVKVNGREKTVRVETPGRLNLYVTSRGDIRSDFLWLPYFQFGEESCGSEESSGGLTGCCRNNKCLISMHFRNMGAPASSVMALLRVPKAIQVDGIKTRTPGTKGSPDILHWKKITSRRTTEKVQHLIISLGTISPDHRKVNVLDLRVYFHIRKGVEECVRKNGVQMSGYVLSFIDRGGVRRRLPITGTDGDVYSPCEIVDVTVRELNNTPPRSKGKHKKN